MLEMSPDFYNDKAYRLGEVLHREIVHTDGGHYAWVVAAAAPLDPFHKIRVDLGNVDAACVYAGLLVLEYRVQLGYGRSESVTDYANWLTDNVGVNALTAIKLAEGAVPTESNAAKIFKWFIKNENKVPVLFDDKSIQAVFMDIARYFKQSFVGV